MASRAKPVEQKRAAPRLYLLTPPVSDPARLAGALASALTAADVAAVLVPRTGVDERTMIKTVKALAPAVQDRGAALILDGHPEIVARAGADGAHLTGIDDFNAALTALKPERIVGCGGLTTRHDAMLAAEAGADYVMFGEPDPNGRRPSFAAVLERVSWWAEVFEIPCVGYAENFDEIAPLAEAGADFVAAGAFVFDDARGAAAAVADAAARLVPPEVAA